MSEDLKLALAEGISALGLSLGQEAQKQLLDYMALIQKWNKVYNLTALRDPQEILTHHLLDSLSAIGPLLQQTRSLDGAFSFLDVGSGGGLPGWSLLYVAPG